MVNSKLVSMADLETFIEELINLQKDIDPEFIAVVNDNYWDLLDTTDNG